MSTAAVCEVGREHEIGGGGEARIYRWPDDGGLVAKVYHRPSEDHRRKLALMIASPPDDPQASEGRRMLAWPVDLIERMDGGPAFAGYLMPKVNRLRPVIDLFSADTRARVCPAFTYRYLVRVARNLAAVVHAIHARGYVIGDLRELNVMVSDDARVTLIDTDSFQVRDPATGETFRCPVWTPEYTPPELKGRDVARVDRTQEHDRFALAVLIFQILMEGWHPFDGVYTGTGDAPNREERIAHGWFPHGRKRSPVRPSRGTPPIGMLSRPVRERLLRAFEHGGRRPRARPTALDWRDCLDAAEKALVTCGQNANHVHWPDAGTCPWCSRRALLRGFDPFPAPRMGPSTLGVRPARTPLPGSTPPAGAPSHVRAAPAAGLVRAAVLLASISAVLAVVGVVPPLAVAPALTAVATALCAWARGGRRRPFARTPAGAAALAAAGAALWSVGSAGLAAWLERPREWRPEPGSRPGEVRINARDLAEVVFVPPGTFAAGAADGYPGEGHARTVYLSGFWIYRHEVTVAMYKRFALATGRSMPPAAPWGWRDRLPIVNVSRRDAEAYAAWCGGSLPGEGQWEKAARGMDGRRYPWGGSPDTGLCVSSGDRRRSGPDPVGSRAAGSSPYGCLDMAGNVAEWCVSVREHAAAGAPSLVTPPDGAEVTRGGSWRSAFLGPDLRASARGFVPAGWRDDTIGFRCVLPCRRAGVIGPR